MTNENTGKEGANSPSNNNISNNISTSKDINVAVKSGLLNGHLIME